MLENTLISVIIPVFNVQDYITECLSSIAAQTFTTGVECIIVDDCGSDESMEMVQNFLENYKGNISFHIIRHEHNRGLSAARNTGIKNANGKYVLFVDSDDTIYAGCLKTFMEVAKRFPDAEMVAAGAKTNRQDWEKLFTMEKDFPNYADNPQWIAQTMLMRGGWKGIPVTAWNRLVEKNFLLRHQLFFKEGVLHEDELWNFMLAQKLSRIAFCKHNTYYYRTRPNSIITSFKTSDENTQSCLPVWQEMLESFTPELEKHQAQSLWNFINDYYPYCHTNIVRHKTQKILWQLVRKNIWPTSLFIFLYLMPFIFYVKFIRKLVAKMSRIRLSKCQPTMPTSKVSSNKCEDL